MSAERFRDAVDAYRDATRSERGRGRDTRERIRGTLVKRARRKRTTVAIGGALAMAFFATSAWAYTTGRLEQWLEPAMEESTPAAPALEEPARSVRRGPRVAPVVEPEPIEEEIEEEIEEVEEPAPIDEAPIARVAPGREAIEPAVRRTSRQRAQAETPLVPPVETAEASRAVEEPDDTMAALYRDAHEAHFRGGDAAEAARLWTNYLNAGSTGRLRTEALYNRALAYVRLGRYDQAIGELEPFANGVHGRYRREEAARLIEAIRARTATSTPEQ